MKKSIHIRLIIPAVLLALVLMAACKKFTEVKPVSEFNIEQVFSSIPGAFNALLGVYDELQGDAGYGIRISLYYPYDSDEGVVTGNIDNGRRGIGRYQLLLTNDELANPFNQLYRGIEKANLCIEQIPLMSLYSTGTALLTMPCSMHF